MAKKEFTFKGFTTEELQKMSVKEFSDIAPSRTRRSLKRGFTEPQKALVKKIESGKKSVKTHCRDMIIIPSMIGMNIKIHSGKDFFEVTIQPEMVGHYLGEFSLSRKVIKHSSPGVGATKSSSSVSVK